MARQLIFTSSPQGLEPGRSGYCTVARHKDLRSRLVRELERLSLYDFNQQGDGPKAEVAIFRKLALGSEEFFVVSRIRDAGLDYTNRTNYIAHHLILDSFEIATVPSPAEILSNWSGWLAKWEDPPRYLDESEEVDLTNCKTPGLIPANAWLAATNDPGNAATLVSPAMKKPVVLEVHAGQEESLLKLFAESSALHKLSLDAWDYSFTTFLQENDDARGFAWVGARGQPAAERLKQSSPNYLDLRDFSQSSLKDPIDDDLAYVARKGPKVKATGAKSPKTRAKAPKAFSDREMAQFQQTASGYTASAAPAGSAVAAQDAGASTQKKRKKRPWLMQLIVISTALCLLVGLVVGLAFNLGDWLNEGGQEPDPNDIVKGPPDIDKPTDSLEGEPVVEGAVLMIGEPGVVVLRDKHPLLRWIKLDVGAPEPVTVNLSLQDQDDYFNFLENYEPNDSLRISLNRSPEGLLAIETLEEATPEEAVGEPFEAKISGGDAVALSEDGSTVTFDIPEQGKLSYEIPVERHEFRDQVQALVAFFRENPTAVAPVKLRLEDGRIVGIDAINIPGSSAIPPVTPVLPEPKGESGMLEVGNPQDFEVLEGQNLVKIKVDGLGTTKYYHFAPEEEEKILKAVEFLKKGGKGLKLRITQDAEGITSLSYKLPALSSSGVTEGPDPAGPMGRTPVESYVLWLPGTKLPGNAARWQLNLPSSGSIRYEASRFSSSLDALLRVFDGLDSARVWQTNFSGPKSFYNLAENEDAFETFAVEVETDRVEPESRASFSLKTAGSSRAIFSLKFDVKKGGYVDVDLTADMAKNAADRGFALRIPRGSEECIDLYFISNKHLSAENGYPPVERKNQLSLEQSTFRLVPSWPVGRRFRVLTQGKQGTHGLLLAPAVGSGGTSRRDVFFSSSMPDPNAFVTGAINGFPNAIVIPKQGEELATSIVMNFEYFNWLGGNLQGQIQRYEADLNQKKAVLPDLDVYQNLVSFGQMIGKQKFVPGEAPYGEYLLELTTAFAKQTLGWDDPQGNTFRKSLVKLSDAKKFHLNQKTLSQFWRTARETIKKEAELPLSGFSYSEERAERDVQSAFRIVDFFLHAEMAFGMKDTNLANELRQAREAFDDFEKETSLLGKLQKELLLIRGKPKAEAAVETFKKFNTSYLERASKMVPPQTLVWGEYAKAMKLLDGDPQAAALFERQRQGLARTEAWVKRLKAKLSDLQAVRSTVLAGGGSRVQQARERLANEKWALALFKINSVAGGQPALERVADIVTFR